MLKLHKQLMNVKEYIQDVISSIAAEAREKGITINFKNGFRDEISVYGNGRSTRNSPRKVSLDSKHLPLQLLDMVGRNHSLSRNAGRKSSRNLSGVDRKVGALMPVEVQALLGGDTDDVVDLVLRDVLHADKFKLDQVQYIYIYEILLFFIMMVLND